MDEEEEEEELNVRCKDGESEWFVVEGKKFNSLLEPDWLTGCEWVSIVAGDRWGGTPIAPPGIVVGACDWDILGVDCPLCMIVDPWLTPVEFICCCDWICCIDGGCDSWGAVDIKGGGVCIEFASGGGGPADECPVAPDIGKGDDVGGNWFEDRFVTAEDAVVEGREGICKFIWID